MSIFLRLSDRYEKALETFDPLAGEPLFRLLDPWPNKRESAAPQWLRVFLFILLVYAPMWLFCAVPSLTVGGNLLGTLKNGVRLQDGIVRDYGLYGMLFFASVSIPLILLSRRLLGALVLEVVELGIVGPEFKSFIPSSKDNGRVLRFLEWATRLSTSKGLVLWLVFVASHSLAYRAALVDRFSHWTFALNQPGSFFYFWRTSAGQPNLAGLWAFCVFFPLLPYLILPIVRLIVIFACMCSELARAERLRIIPAHPDGTGGLKPIGEVALFQTLFFLAVGLDLMALTANELLATRAAGHISSSEVILASMWVGYLLAGSLLFFLPLLPLRARMMAAKRRFLIEALVLKSSAERMSEADMGKVTFRPDTLQGLVALDLQIQSASDMAIWPFDRKTFLRYAGLFISPLAPFVVDHFPEALKYLKEWALSAPK